MTGRNEVAGRTAFASNLDRGIGRRALFAGAAGLALCGTSGAVQASDMIPIGAIFPMTGENGQVGFENVHAMSVMLDIVNGTDSPVPMRLGNGGGLAGMGGARLRLVTADHEGNIQKARAEATRLIEQQHVVAIIGSYQSATAAAISQVTERYGIPYISADSSSPSLHRRGLRWFFRTGPHDETFTQAMFDFYADMGHKTGRPVRSATLIYEDSIFGNDSSAVQRQLAQDANIPILADIKYRANSHSLALEAAQVKDSDADVLMPSSYTSDAILLIRSLAELGYRPRAIVSQAAGFQQQTFLDAVGPLADGIFSRGSFALDTLASRPAIAPVNARYRARTGRDLSDNASRALLALQVLADAIDRAGSVEPPTLRAALQATRLDGVETIMPWRGVRFDDSGQNVDCTPVVQQVSGGVYHTVYPFDVAVRPPVWRVGT